MGGTTCNPRVMTGVRHTMCVAVAALLSALALAPVASARTWHEGIAIAPVGSGPGPPAAAVGENGEALAAWTVRLAGGRARVEARVRRGYRSAWRRQTLSGTFAAPPTRVAAGIAADGASVVAWRIPGGPVRAAVRDRRDAAWRVLAVPSGPATAGFFDFWSPRVTVGPGGEATLVWTAREAEGWVARGAHRAGRGAPWRTTPPLVIGSAAAAAPALALDTSGDAVAAWFEPAGTGSPLLTGPVRASLRQGTGAWGAATTLSATGYAPSAVVAGGRALVAWEERPGADVAGADVRLAAGEVSTQAWAAPETVADGRAPIVTADAAGDALLSWAGPAAADGSAPFLAALRPAGGRWEAPLTLVASPSLSAIEVGRAHGAMSARGRAFTAVTDPEGPGSATTVLATRPLWGGPWDRVALPVGADDPDVALAASPSGDAVALVPASRAVSGGDTVIAVSYDGAARPVVRARISGRRQPDGAVAWSVIVRNAGRVAAKGVRLRLSICCGARLLASRPAGVPETRPWVTWSLGSLAAGRATTVRLTVRPAASGASPPRLGGEVWAIAAPRAAVGGVAVDAAGIPVLG